MKKLLYIFLLPLLFSCNSNTLTIQGDVIDGDVTKIRLAIVENAKLTWIKTIENPSIKKYKFDIDHQGDKKQYGIFVNDELIPVHKVHTFQGIHQKDIDMSAFYANEEKTIYTYNLDRKFNLYQREYSNSNNALSAEYREVKKTGSPLQIARVKRQYEAERELAMDEFIKKITKLISDNPDNELAFKVLNSYLSQIPFDDLESIMSNASSKIKATENYRMIKGIMESKQELEVGKIAPNFKVKTLEGNEIELSDYRGKVVVIDFWASWCRPCIAALPGMKELYTKYKNKGLEIISISIDSKASAWEKASEENQIPFVNVSNLLGNNCPIAQRYAVSAVPHVYLIDQKGILIGDKMTKNELAAKVAELLK